MPSLLSRQRFLSLAALGAALLPARGALAQAGAAAPAAAAGPAAAPAVKERCVFQVSDADMGKWQLTLANAANAQALLGRDGVDLEILAFGPGVDGLRADSQVGARVAEAGKAGIKVLACQNTLRARHLTEADLLPGIGTVPSGVVHLMRRQREGWAVIRS